jgi:3-vinyl bacteriochlorophyllide hydratase
MLMRAADRRDPSYGSHSPHSSRFPRSISHHRDVPLSNNLYTGTITSVAAGAKADESDSGEATAVASRGQRLKLLYTSEQRLRRDATKWTLVQGILAPVQFLVFLISLALVVRYLATGDGLSIATISIVVKTVVLYAIMVTGSIWEREVFGCYLFAAAFFWEDVFSFLVLALHTAYLVALFAGVGTPVQQMLLALAAYASYAINATQFLLKLRAARRDERLVSAMSAASEGRA